MYSTVVPWYVLGICSRTLDKYQYPRVLVSLYKMVSYNQLFISAGSASTDSINYLWLIRWADCVR